MGSKIGDLVLICDGGGQGIIGIGQKLKKVETPT